jgi:hypothetical protein
LRRAHWLELAALAALAALLAAALQWAGGKHGWSWDALNHHVYLGLVAEQPRWQLDVIPASYQSYQYPYLYWPVYKLADLGLGAPLAATIWAALQALLLLPPLWLIALRLLPEPGAVLPPWLERGVACLLGMLSLVIVASLQTTANDLLAAVPLLWAIAVWTQPGQSLLSAAGGAALLGVSVAFKLSNGLYVPLLLLWWWRPGTWAEHKRRAVFMTLAFALGLVLAYGPWGWQLWQHTGNPFYPYFGAWFVDGG